MRCPYCKTQTKDDSKFCPNCKKRIFRCPSCGEALYLNQKFCSNDGMPIPKSVYEEEHALESDKKRKNTRKGKKIFVSVLIITLAIIVVGFSLGGYFLYKDVMKKKYEKYSQKISKPIDEKTIEENTVTYKNGDSIYHPQEESLAWDEEEHTLYYDNLITVYLAKEISREEAEKMAESINGEVVTDIRGIMNTLQIMVQPTDLENLMQLSDKLMELENVLYASYDFPMEVETTSILESDRNPWGGEQNRGCEESPDGNDWWAEAIGAYTAWEYDDLANEITVGVLDNGFDLKHEEFLDEDGNTKIELLEGYSENTVAEHGTHVAGIIGAYNNEKGIRGIADKAKILGVDWSPITDDKEDENYNDLLDTGEYIEITNQMLEQGVKVINNSWRNVYYSKEGYVRYDDTIKQIYKEGKYNEDNIWDEGKKNLAKFFSGVMGVYDDYIEYEKVYQQRTAMECMIMIIQVILNDENTAISPEKEKFLIVQSAGNGYYRETKTEPVQAVNTKNSAWYCSIDEEVYSLLKSSTRDELEKKGINYSEIKKHIIIVGATNKINNNGEYELTQFSNYGDNVDICAPGEDIYSSVPNNGYDSLSGTSMSAPMVSGAAALIWSMDPSLSAGEVKEILQNTAGTAVGVAKEDTREEYPMLNVGRAVERVVENLEGEKINDISSEPTNSNPSKEEMILGTVYDDYLASLRENQTYETAQYAIIDIDQDSIPELLIYNDRDDMLFAYTYREGNVIQLANCPDAGFGHILELHYSSKYKALVPYDRTSGTHEERFFELNETRFSHLFSVGWEDQKAATYTRYYTYRDDTSSKSLGSYIYSGENYDEATEEKNKQEVLNKYNEYAGDLEEIKFYSLADFSVGGVSHEEKIQNIKTIYYDIEDNLGKMRVQESGGTTRYIDDTKRIRKIIAPIGTYDNPNNPIVEQYKAEYSYKDDNLIFIFVTNGEEEYKFYMDGYSCLRYIDADGNVQDYEDGISGSEISEVGGFCTLGMLELHWAY